MKIRHRLALGIVSSLLTIFQADAQGSAGTDAAIESRYIIDYPTAGLIGHGSVAADFEFFEANGMLARVSLGAWDRLLLGISFGGSNIVGTGQPTWNKAPGIELRLRVIEENLVLPAMAIGFSSQGKETFISAMDRYTIKSPGLYAVASKNYQAMGFLSFHGGINYSMEHSDNDEDINLFGGVEKTLGPFASITAEYDLSMNDSNSGALGKGRGYLNFGLRCAVGNGLALGIVLKDVLRNQQDASLGNRVVQLEYVR
ncbi:MAG TPA: hypothetical protein VL633_04370 [Bacteroidota bacterium]|nr:hypothetical protein [Bacteroidota bacterium]